MWWLWLGGSASGSGGVSLLRSQICGGFNWCGSWSTNEWCGGGLVGVDLCLARCMVRRLILSLARRLVRRVSRRLAIVRGV